MTVSILQNLSSVLFLFSILFFVLSAILFFVLRIPSVIGYLTGSAQRRAVEEIARNSRRGTVRREKNFSAKKIKEQNGVRNRALSQTIPLSETDVSGTVALTENAQIAESLPMCGAATVLLVNDSLKTEPLHFPETDVFQIESELVFTESTEIIQ